MHRHRLTSFVLAATFGLAAPAPASAVDRLYKRDVDAVAAEIVWGNRAAPEHRREVLAIDPPLPRIGPAEPKVEVLELFRYDIGRTYRGTPEPWARNASELLARWRASLPPEVNVVRVPIAVPARPRGGWRWNWVFAARTHLRMLLVGRALRIEDAVHDSLLAALDEDPDAFRFPVRTGFTATPEAIADLQARAREHFRTRLGIEHEQFDEAWDSATVADQMERSIVAHDHTWTTSDRNATRGIVDPRHLPPSSSSTASTSSRATT